MMSGLSMNYFFLSLLFMAAFASLQSYILLISILFLFGWLWCTDGITDLMEISLSKFRKLVTDSEAWRAAVHGVTKSQT